MVLTRTLYGEEAAKRPDLLPEQDKERIRTLSSAVAAVVGGVVGRNAVENNYLLESDWSDYYRQMRACGNNERCIDNTREWLTRRSAWRNFLLDGICRRDIQRCREKHTDATRSARLTSIHMNIGRGPILSNPQNIRNSRFSTSTPRYDPRRPDLNALSYYDRVAKNIQPSDYLLTRENLNTLNQLAKHPAIQEEYRNNPSFRSEFKSEAEAAMRASFGDNEMWMRDEPKLYGFEMINRQNPQDQIQYPVGAGGLKPVHPELWFMPAPKIGILGSFSSKLFAGLERSGGGKVLQWMARVQPASERALVLNARKPALQTMVGSYSQQTIEGTLGQLGSATISINGITTPRYSVGSRIRPLFTQEPSVYRYFDHPVDNGILNIGAGNKPILGAYNITLPKAGEKLAPGVYPGDANNLTNIANYSQRKIIMENPYGFNPLNDEILRVLHPEGEIVIRGSIRNGYINRAVRNAERFGMKVIHQKEIPNNGFMHVDGITPVKGSNIQEYILIRSTMP